MDVGVQVTNFIVFHSHNIIFTLRFLLNIGHNPNISIENVTVENECHVVCSLDAKQTDANNPAFNDRASDTLKISTSIIHIE